MSSGFYERPVSQDWNARFGLEPEWYAVHTRSQHEKSVVSHLQGAGITCFLPLVTEVHRWSDRRKLVALPLFSCYAFVRISLVPELWNKVTKTAANATARTALLRNTPQRPLYRSQRFTPVFLNCGKQRLNLARTLFEWAQVAIRIATNLVVNLTRYGYAGRQVNHAASSRMIR